MHYEDFEIRIQRNRRRGYKLELLHSLYGPAESVLEIPLTRSQTLDLPEAFEHQVRGEGLGNRSLSTVQRLYPHPKDIGHMLFRALFAGDVGKRFRDCLAHLDGRHRDEGLRIRLSFDLNDPSLTVLAALPWEILWDSERDEFLSRVRRTPIVRFMPVPRPPLTPMEGTLRILVLQSNPIGSPILDLASEWRNIWSSFKWNPAIEVSSIEHPTLAGLRQILLEETWHVLHFMGHGGFDRQNGEGSLYFEDLAGSIDRITGTMLAEHMKSFPDLRLVFLNACQTGVISRRNGQDPFTGVASALLRAGVPAVLAMQFPISDSAAINFSSSFYARIAARDPVDAAVVEGRLAVLRQRSFEWATPVLFSRVPDGDILGLGSRPSSAPLAGPSIHRASPLRLGIRSFSDTAGSTPWGQEMEGECEEILDLRPYFKGRNGRYIRDKKLWQTKIVRELRSFLGRITGERRPIHLNLSAHASIAFVAGYFLNTKSGLDVTLRQRGRMGVVEWRALVGSPPSGVHFRDESDIICDSGSRNVALALGISQEVLDDVKLYLSRSRFSVRRIWPTTIAPEPSPIAVRDGLHALQLAQAVAYKIRGRTIREREGTLHLFGAAPNAFFFFLGQISHGLGSIQLYEYDTETMRPGAYRPSILIPPSGQE